MDACAMSTIHPPRTRSEAASVPRYMKSNIIIDIDILHAVFISLKYFFSLVCHVWRDGRHAWTIDMPYSIAINCVSIFYGWHEIDIALTRLVHRKFPIDSCRYECGCVPGSVSATRFFFFIFNNKIIFFIVSSIVPSFTIILYPFHEYAINLLWLSDCVLEHLYLRIMTFILVFVLVAVVARLSTCTFFLISFGFVFYFFRFQIHFEWGITIVGLCSIHTTHVPMCVCSMCCLL